MLHLYRKYMETPTLGITDIHFAITPDTIDINLKYTDEEKAVKAAVVSIDKEYFQKVIHDCSVVYVFIDDLTGNYELIEKYKFTSPNLNDDYKFIKNYAIKLCTIMVVSKDAPFTEMEYVCNLGQNVTVTSTLEVVNETGNVPPSMSFFPTFTIDGPDTVSIDSPGEVYTVTCSVDGTVYTVPLTIYPKARQGYVNKQKITISGEVTIKFLPLGLDVGDTAEFCVGFKNRDTVASKMITIVA